MVGHPSQGYVVSSHNSTQQGFNPNKPKSSSLSNPNEQTTKNSSKQMRLDNVQKAQFQTKKLEQQNQASRTGELYKNMHKKVKSTGQGSKDFRQNFNSASSNNKASSKYMNNLKNDSYNISINTIMDEGGSHAVKSVSLNRKEQDEVNKASKKSNRITATTRGITSGTNARVNTFDNRAI